MTYTSIPLRDLTGLSVLNLTETSRTKQSLIQFVSPFQNLPGHTSINNHKLNCVIFYVQQGRRSKCNPQPLRRSPISPVTRIGLYHINQEQCAHVVAEEERSITCHQPRGNCLDQRSPRGRLTEGQMHQDGCRILSMPAYVHEYVYSCLLDVEHRRHWKSDTSGFVIVNGSVAWKVLIG